MSSDEIAIHVRDVSKRYLLFNRPQDRLKQSIVPRLQRVAGRKPKQYYRDFAALSHVSFSVRRGETVGVIGRNGSGKSTLLQVICGTLRPNAGTVEVNGRIAALLELGAGFNPDFTGRENVYMNAAILGLPRAEIDARFDEIARFADIGDFIEQPVKTFSSGMYVRLAFATAINVDPDILVVDEALAVGDEAFQRKCFARIEQIQEHGGTILFVTHSVQTVVQLCNRALLFDGGELLLDGPPKLVTSQYQRLIYAPPHVAGIIRSQLVTNTSRDKLEFRAHLPSDESVSTTIDLEQFDPNLKPISIISYEENGANIHDFIITNLDGRRVNTLVPGRRYNFKYSVRFLRANRAVAFAILIKTLTGVEIAGQTSHFPGEGLTVNQGELLTASFPVRCNLLPGTYCCNAGVYINAAGEFTQLHRLLDGLIFRVAPHSFLRPRMGYFDVVDDDQPVLFE